MGLLPPPILPIHLYLAVLFIGLIFYPFIIKEFFKSPLWGTFAALSGAIINVIATAVGTISSLLKASFDKAFDLVISTADNIMWKMGVSKETRKGVTDFLKMIRGDVAIYKKSGSDGSRDASSSRSSRRGEHVINLAVLSVHRDILERFLRDSGYWCQPYRDTMNRILEEDFFGGEIRKIIEDATVFFDSSEDYNDENSFPFGIFLQSFIRATVYHMQELWDLPEREWSNTGSQNWHDTLETVASIIAKTEAFVDKKAREKYLKKVDRKEEKALEKAVEKVKELFEKIRDHAKVWIKKFKKGK